ncbi:hypothetical protein F4553_001120 [Allocatelliglobosispora scoriae]|uniref:Uncharacterized protein n=1 Tax=Allocatelliglobosispora scoriae TaxID=643052 RepID=A0A841BLK2_9ACTN|nr:hypothetical protein [Allocatelliglobosispora scoriae]MBB5867741.1 hypothetical protein [Allocatelliglobosispora scoriae]
MSRSPRVARLAVLAIALTTAVSAVPAHAATPDARAWVLRDQSAATPSVVPYGTFPAATTVSTLAVGRYLVTFPGQGASGGIVHVTAVATTPKWCQAENWFQSGPDELVIIRCHQPGGALVASGFSAFFTSSSPGGSAFGPYGYVDSNASGSIVSQFNSTGAANTSVSGPPGQWTVTFPGLLPGISALAGGVQATAVNPQIGARCKVGSWNSVPIGTEVQVYCFNAVGAPLNTRFTATYQFTVALYGANAPPNNHGYVFATPAPGPIQTNYNSQLGFGANTVAPITSPPGLAFVTFPNVGAGPNTVQVTAYGTSSNFCGMSNPWINVSGGPSVFVRNVNCFSATGGPATTGFLASTSSLV